MSECGDGAAQQVAAYEERIEQLYAEIGRLTTQVAWPRKNWRSLRARGAHGHDRAR